MSGSSRLWLARVLLVGLGPWLAACGASVQTPLASSPISADELVGPCEVTRFVDGDTVTVRCIGGTPARIRLLNVDTPERGDAGYEAARVALQRLVGEGPVFLLFEEPGVPSWGNFGRLLAYLVRPDGTNLNLELVRGGWSPYYTKYGPGRFPLEFSAAAQGR